VGSVEGVRIRVVNSGRRTQTVRVATVGDILDYRRRTKEACAAWSMVASWNVPSISLAFLAGLSVPSALGLFRLDGRKT
jgi:hypothetical protein